RSRRGCRASAAIPRSTASRCDASTTGTSAGSPGSGSSPATRSGRSCTRTCCPPSAGSADMPTRTLHVVRHGRADALGRLTEEGRGECRALGRRLAGVPLDVVWHSPLPRAADSAALLAEGRRGLLVDEAPELIDAVPFVPDLASLSPR